MNKAEIIDIVSGAADISKAAAQRAIDTLHETIVDALQKGDSVAFAGFGSYSVSERSARVGRNPQTGEPIQIAASKTVKFKAGKKAKDALNDR